MAGQVSSLGCQTSGSGVAWACTSLGKDVLAEGCSHYLHPFLNYMPSALQLSSALFEQMPGSHYCWGPPAVLSSRSIFLLGEHATISNPTGARERVLGHRAPQCQLDPSNPGVPGGGAPVVGDSLNLPFCLPAVLTSWPYHLALSHPMGLVGATGGAHLSWHYFLGYPQMMWRPPLGEGCMLLCQGGLEDWACPLAVSLWWEVTWGPSTVSTPSGSLWCEVTWGSSLWYPEGWDLLHWWIPKHQWPLEWWQLPEHCQQMEWFIHSIFSLSSVTTTRACWWASLARAIIPLYKSCLAVVNLSFVWWLAVVNSICGLHQGMSGVNCLYSPCGCVGSHLSWRHSLRELRISLWRCSLVASSHQPLLGSLCSWYRSQ